MISRFIIKTNQWYEKLPGIKGDLFYLAIIIIPYISIFFIVDSFSIIPKFSSLPSMMWVVVVVLWRLSYKLIMEFKSIQKIKK